MANDISCSSWGGYCSLAKMRQEIIYSIETMEVRIELNMVLSRRCKCEKILWI